MSFEADLKAHLQGESDISDLVSDRINPILLRKGVGLPALTYTIVYGEPQNSLDGYTSGLSRYSVQLDVWASTFREMRLLAELVRDRMNVAADSFQSVITQYPLLEDYESDTERYRRAVGVSCWHKEP